MTYHPKVDYVLVVDVSDNGRLYYYAGYYNENFIPENTQDYNEAFKIENEEEANSVCIKLNELDKSPFKYHVEEHSY